MSIEEKVALVREAIQGYTLPAALAAVELSRSTWYYHQRRRVR